LGVGLLKCSWDWRILHDEEHRPPSCVVLLCNEVKDVAAVGWACDRVNETKCILNFSEETSWKLET
jgi:hypothetical protein